MATTKPNLTKSAMAGGIRDTDSEVSDADSVDGNASNVLRGNGSFGPEANGVFGNTLTANLDANGFFISNAANITANYFVGTATNVEVEAVNNNYSYHIQLG